MQDFQLDSKTDIVQKHQFKKSDPQQKSDALEKDLQQKIMVKAY